MCSIIGSFKKDKIIELCELNKYRGTYSHSISYYDVEERDVYYTSKSYGDINYDRIDIDDGTYCIVHMQAPTSEISQKNIHPAERAGHLLWHNGILKDTTIKRLQVECIHKTDWDTSLLLDKMIMDKKPDDVDGSFSCLYFDSEKRKLFLFRNAIAPMFIDDDFNISSTKFDGGHAVEHGVIWDFEPHKRRLTSTEFFETVNNPYRI